METEFEEINDHLPMHYRNTTMNWDIFEGIYNEFEEEPDTSLLLEEVIREGTEHYKVISVSDPIWGMEVGDDRVDLSTSSARLSIGLIAQEKIFMMKTSLKDTFITNNLWNFCEVSSAIPCSKDESFEHARLKGNFSNLGFVDCPPIRIIIDCMKSDRSHSSTVSGKSTMLGTRVETPRTELRDMMMMSSYLQDGMLATCRSPDPKYLPSIMGGCGVPALFDSPWNLYLYVRSYRGGGYQRVYGTATSELRRCVESHDYGRPMEPSLCLRLRDKQEYLFGTYANSVLLPPKDQMDFSGRMPPPLYKALGVQNSTQNVELRLQRTKLLVPRSQAEREFEKTIRIHDAIFSSTKSPVSQKVVEKHLKMRLRQQFEGALQANSAFKRLLDREANGDEVEELIRTGFMPVHTGRTMFDMNHAIWIFNGCKGGIHSAHDLTRSEDMFFRTDVSTEETFKIGGIPLNIRLFGKTVQQMTKTHVGLYQINESMIEWSDRVGATLRHLQHEWGTIPQHTVINQFLENREWINDDTLLIRKCLDDTKDISMFNIVALVSQDRRLANQMSVSANVNVLLIDTESLIECYPERTWNADTKVTPEDIRKVLPRNFFLSKPILAVYIDVGSLAHVAARYSKSERGKWDRAISKRTLAYSGRDPVTGARTAVYDIEILERRPRVTVRTYKPTVNRQKSFRLSKSSGSSSSSDNWRERSFSIGSLSDSQ